MSPHYIPDVNIDQVDPSWETILLSTRDAAQDIPINFKPTPSISLTRACFSDGEYTASKSTCLSNLLAFGYSRFVIDLYWLPDKSEWSLCPTSTLSSVSSPQGNQIVCDDALGGNLDWLWSFWNDWLEKTEYNTLASVVVLVFNLYPDVNIRGDTDAGSKPPSPIWSASRDFPSRIYTPLDLRQDRENLNVTWLNGGDEGDDEGRYFTVRTRQDGGLSSVDAWPSEGYLSFEKGERLLLGFGDVWVQGFEFEVGGNGDGDYFFGKEQIGWPYKESNKAKCFFDTGKTSVSEVNNSWAGMVGDRWTREAMLEAVGCGYSPLVNSTAVSTTTATNIPINSTNSSNSSPDLANPLIDYFALIKGTIWSWAPGQPSPPPSNMTDKEIDLFRCAVMDTHTGRWVVADCNEHYRAACRVDDRPYKWTVGDRPGSYSDARKLCPKRASFDVPRSALENRYLWRAMNETLAASSAQASRKSRGGEGLVVARRDGGVSGLDRAWVDFQSLGHRACWVRGGDMGAEQGCPYGNEDQGNKKVIVPTVAAVIVLVVAGLMVFVKVGSGRWERRRKKRWREARKWGKEGWEYEGVPA
ncbi:hypothetical protein EV426DRAFT_715129 [Tirmania nivea]|nr:hypothetical protein EV426DRAFT_715129 [Tirmania nivea]